MSAVARGDIARMDAIYRNRRRPLFRFFYRLTGRQTLSEDLVHEVFLRILRYRHTWQDGMEFDAWMYRIARNALVDHGRKRRLENPSLEGDAESVQTRGPSPLEAVMKQQHLATLYRALRELPEEKRELIVLSRFQGLNYEQIGQIVGCEAGAVKGRMFRTMNELGRIFEQMEREKAS